MTAPGARTPALAVRLQEVAIDSPAARALVAEVQQEYVARYGGEDATPMRPDEFAPPGGTFLIAWEGEEPLGCAGLRRHDDGVSEIKRMYVRPGHRRRGVARLMLSALEDWARRRGYRRMVLESGAAQPEAIALYTSAGYEPVEGYGHYRCSPLSRSFGRDL